MLTSCGPKIQDIFLEEPKQWGYRGDVFLWRDLKGFFEDKHATLDEAEFYTQLLLAFEQLTGQPLAPQQIVFIEKYNHGGMSGGGISSEFWLETGIPLLRRRYQILRTTQAVLEQQSFLKYDANSPHIKLVRGDITKVTADAIVNAANSSLLGGGGVDGAIHRAGGSEILEDCRKIIAKQGKCEIGHAVITRAGKLSAKFVIHTVGPVWNNGQDVGRVSQQLADCYENALQLAVTQQCRTVAFPNISTGIYKFPKDKAAKIALDTVFKFISQQRSLNYLLPLDQIIFVCFDQENYDYYSALLAA